MTKSTFIAAALALALFTPPAARAQVSIDMTKITCDQWLLYKVADPQLIAIWIHGFYSGKRNNTTIEPEKLKSDADKVKDYCRNNLQMPVMQAVENLFGPAK